MYTYIHTPTYIHILVRQHKEELREIKKKKAQKKLARSQEVEQHRETEKQRWKNFTTKVTNRSILLVQYSIYSHKIFFYMSVCMYVCMYVCMKSARQRGGPINSKQKKSIFAVPDSIEGRVSL